MKKKRFSLILVVLCLLGSVWAWSSKQTILGYISTGVFLCGVIISLVAYIKDSKC